MIVGVVRQVLGIEARTLLAPDLGQLEFTRAGAHGPRLGLELLDDHVARDAQHLDLLRRLDHAHVFDDRRSLDELGGRQFVTQQARQARRDESRLDAEPLALQVLLAQHGGDERQAAKDLAGRAPFDMAPDVGEPGLPARIHSSIFGAISVQSPVALTIAAISRRGMAYSVRVL